MNNFLITLFISKCSVFSCIIDHVSICLHEKNPDVCVIAEHGLKQSEIIQMKVNGHKHFQKVIESLRRGEELLYL